jgi:hypothetical protein
MITVILNVYKRPHTLEKQIEAIKAQTVPISDENIWIWYNKSDVVQPPIKNGKHKTFRCNHNFKFHGRFAAAMLAQTEYIAMFDDDVIPGKNWFKNCLDTMEIYQSAGKNTMLGGSGVLLDISTQYTPNIKVGWNGNHFGFPTNVDLVGHAWFWKTEHTKYMWYEKPITWDNGEDIMFSYQLQKYGNVETVVPPHPETDKTLWSCDPIFGFKHGNDKVASWLVNNDHNKLRDQIVKHCYDNGWKMASNNYLSKEQIEHEN